MKEKSHGRSSKRYSRSRSRSRDRKKHKHKKHKHESRKSRRRSVSLNKCEGTSNKRADNSNNVNDSSDVDYGPAPVSNTVEEVPEICGPALPPHMLNNERVDENNLKEVKRQLIIGPSLPPSVTLVEDNSISSEAQNKEEVADINNTTDIDDDDDDQNDAYGPLPPDATRMTKAHLALEERALQLKIDKLNTTSETKEGRESWMLELPNVERSKLGLGPRQFRATPAPDLSDRSSWTDTPTDKQNKKEEGSSTDQLKKEAESDQIIKRDKQQEDMAKKNKAKRKEKSLLELHQEKIKKDKKKLENDGVRRPFSREIDLQANKFDEAQKKSILKKAQLLDDRFSKGQSKYL